MGEPLTKLGGNHAENSASISPASSRASSPLPDYFAKSQALAERLDMPYALAITHREMARLDPKDTPARHAHTERARALFLACGAVQDAGNCGVF